MAAFVVLLGISLANYQSNAECIRNPRKDNGQCKTWGDGSSNCLEKYDHDLELDCIR